MLPALKQCGVPKTVADIQQHHCIQLLSLRTGQPMKWSYGNSEAKLKKGPKVTGADTVRVLALAGVGLTHLIEFVVQEDLQKGRLQTVLSKLESPRRQAFALYQERQFISQRVQLFLDFLSFKESVE